MGSLRWRRGEQPLAYVRLSSSVRALGGFVLFFGCCCHLNGQWQKSLLFLASKRSPLRTVGMGLTIVHTLGIECKLRNHYATVTSRIMLINCQAHIFHTTKNLFGTLCAKIIIGLLVTFDNMDGRVISGEGVDTTAHPNVAVCNIHTSRAFTVRWQGWGGRRGRWRGLGGR